MAVKFIKDPAAVLDYQAKWVDWLAPGDSIVAVTASISGGTGLTAQSTAYTANTATVWLTGGTSGVTYTVTLHITTSQSRQDERSFQVVVKDR